MHFIVSNWKNGSEVVDGFYTRDVLYLLIGLECDLFREADLLLCCF